MIPLTRGAVRSFLAAARRAAPDGRRADPPVRVGAGDHAVTLAAHFGSVVLGRRLVAVAEVGLVAGLVAARACLPGGTAGPSVPAGKVTVEVAAARLDTVASLLVVAGAVSAYSTPPPSLLAAYRAEPDLARFHLELKDYLKLALTATLLGVLPRP